MRKAYFLPLTLLLLAACSDSKQQHHGPIVLGDSSTIVTETDPKYLENMVADLAPPPILTEQPKAEPAVSDTPRTSAPVAATPDKGFTMAFKEVTLFIPDIETYEYRRQDLSKSNSATYELRGGKLAGNTLQVQSGTVAKVSQRYQTQLALQHGGKELVLESLGNFLSDWQPLSGSGNSYVLKGLEPKQLDYRKVTAAQVRSAVQKAARANRMSKAETAEWEKVARSYKSNQQSPALVVLKAVMWRVEGKGFWKEIRMDVP